MYCNIDGGDDVLDDNAVVGIDHNHDVGDADGVVVHAGRDVDDAVLLQELIRASGHGCSCLCVGVLEDLGCVSLYGSRSLYGRWS